MPGAFELPLAAKYLRRHRPDRGRRLPGRRDPRRDLPLRLRLRARRRAGIARVSLDTGVPCAFGVLTVDEHGPGAGPRRRRQAPPGRGRGPRGAADGRAAPAASSARSERRPSGQPLSATPRRGPAQGMREAIATRRGGRRAEEARPHDDRAAGAGGRAAGPRGGPVPAQRLDVQPDRLPPAHPARRATRPSWPPTRTRRGSRPARPAAVNGAMLRLLDAPTGIFSARRRARRPCAPPATATRPGRGWCRSSRAPTWAAGACGRCPPSATCWRRPTAPACAPTWTAPG